MTKGRVGLAGIAVSILVAACGEDFSAKEGGAGAAGLDESASSGGLESNSGGSTGTGDAGDSNSQSGSAGLGQAPGGTSGVAGEVAAAGGPSSAGEAGRAGEGSGVAGDINGGEAGAAGDGLGTAGSVDGSDAGAAGEAQDAGGQGGTAGSAGTPEQTGGAGQSGTGGSPPLLEQGEACTADSDCVTSACVDGFCCESACSEVCERCDVAGQEGSCAEAASDASCGELSCPPDSVCRTYVEGDLQNNCESAGVCLSQAPCTIENSASGTPCGAAEAPGTCDGAGACVVEGKADLGEGCSENDDCGSGFCVVEGGAGICCDDACDGACEACGSDGRCDQTPTTDELCPLDCNESTACMSYPPDLAAGACTGFGQCQTEALYCTATPEAAGTECGSGMVCNGDGACVDDVADLGAPCSAGSECESGFCAATISGSMICCATACNGVCEACAPDGQCDAVPATDASCSPIDCLASTECTAYNVDLPDGACSGLGQCETDAEHCAPAHEVAGTVCESVKECDGNGSCECPDETGPSQTCSVECPCDKRGGVCSADEECVDGMVCVSAEVAAQKLDFPDRTCMPAHCNNDQLDDADGETSQDCGGECECRATFAEYVPSGDTSSFEIFSINDMDALGTKFAVSGTDMDSRVTYPAVMSAEGVVTLLDNLGADGSASHISDDGTFITGNLRCGDPPSCSSTLNTTFSWTNEGAAEMHNYSGGMSAMSATGAIFTYFGYESATSTYRTRRYERSSGAMLSTTDLGSLWGMSDDGMVLYGASTSDSTKIALWTIANNTVTVLDGPADWASATMVDTSADGSVGVGYHTSSTAGDSSTYAFIRRNGVFESLPLLHSTAEQLSPEALSADGARFVGTSGPSTYLQAAIWDDAGGVRTVADELTARGLELPIDFRLVRAMFLSNDGSVIIGWDSGAPLDGFWRVELLD